VDAVKTKVMACGDKTSAKGSVKVVVKVNGDGSVDSAQVKGAPDATLGTCVAAVMQSATFAKTRNGGSFTYPFVF
jgi:outer membrane biosynthesis protein TonB